MVLGKKRFWAVWNLGCSTRSGHWGKNICSAAELEVQYPGDLTHSFAHLSFARVQLLPQQRLEAVALVQQVEDVGHLVVPGDARQQTHLRS